ncbi:MAG: EAL and GGDEF domain-containing protein [Natronospirillum sp.]
MTPKPSKADIEDIIATGVRSVYQPIVDVIHGEILGYEGLSRGPAGHPLESPLVLFSAAEDYGLLPELELTCRALSVSQFTHRGFQGKLFLNSNPHAFVDPHYPKGRTIEFLRNSSLTPDHIVIELTEKYLTEDYDVLKQALEHYRKMGFQTAIDDLGAGYNGLRLWSEIQPDYVKLDKHFVQGINSDPVKQAFARSVIQLCDQLRTTLIVEGVETPAELELLQDYGVQYVQGYVMARPDEMPVSPQHKLFSLAQQRKVHDLHLAEDLASWVRPVDPYTELGEVWLRLEREPGTHAFPVVTEGRPTGFIQRSRIYELFSKPYGRELFSHKPVYKFIAPHSLIVNRSTGLSALSQMVTSEDDLMARQYFIVVDDDRQYLGVGNTRDLLRKLTDIKLRSARHANPLTHMPGNVPTNEYIEELIRLQQPFQLAYVDIDHFKPFNDTFGYSLGDELILRLSQLLKERLRGRGQYLGHIGGDDFVVVSTHNDPLPQLRLMQQLYREAVRDIVVSAGHSPKPYRAMDRHGEERVFSLPTLSVGLLKVQAPMPDKLDALGSALAKIKHQAKRLHGEGIATANWQDD